MARTGLFFSRAGSALGYGLVQNQGDTNMSKKTETTEVRLSPELKSAFTEVSKRRGHSMSEEVRDLIQGAVAEPVFPRNPGDHVMTTSIRPTIFRSAAMAVPVAALAAVYLMSSQGPAQAVTEARIVFAELDSNSDGQITHDDMAAFAEADGWRPDPACASGDTPEWEPCTIDAMVDAHFDDADSNGDGHICGTEGDDPARTGGRVPGLGLRPERVSRR